MKREITVHDQWWEGRVLPISYLLHGWPPACACAPIFYLLQSHRASTSSDGRFAAPGACFIPIF